ncbi:MAG: DUF4019 domain-containing protein [Verrucomicrobiota bacterium]|jgi:hypothetical protein
MKINLTQSSFVKLLCAALLAVAASGYAAENNAGAEKAATTAAQTWLTEIDNGDYTQSWQEASAFFRSAVTKDKWKTSLETVRKPLGKLTSRKVKKAQSAASLPGAPDGQYVVVQFDTVFADKPSAVETVTFMLENDGQWRAAGYFIK